MVALSREETRALRAIETLGQPEIATVLRNIMTGAYPGRPNFRVAADTTDRVQPSDLGKIIRTTSGSSTLISVGKGLADNFVCGILQYGDGQVTVSADSGVTIVEADSQFKAEKKYVLLTLVAIAQDEYLLVGRTAA